MQKWEYCVVTPYHVETNEYWVTKFYRFTSRGAELVKDFGKLPQKSRADACAQLIAQLGEESWELAGAGNVAEIVHALYFKRPKP